jgi:serine-type D-Ala-D-Ala carboxypeptidase/endopeptidase (penicillin-binding protein 4)
MEKIIRNLPAGQAGLELGIWNWVALCSGCKLNRNLVLTGLSIFISIGSYSQQKQIGKLSNTILLNDSAISTGHIGISIYEPATDKYWYNYNADKYFIPASNTKLFSLYAGMKYLGDSLVGARYKYENNELQFIGNADPTFLHASFKSQPVFNFLKQHADRKITLYQIVPYLTVQKNVTPYGYGWAWDDFGANYMLERNFLPMYGNSAKLELTNTGIQIMPRWFSKNVQKPTVPVASIQVERDRESNFFFVQEDNSGNKTAEVPIKFGVDRYSYSIEDSLLSDTLKTKIHFAKLAHRNLNEFSKIYSQPSDSLFKPMMHNSDNFFAEQTLLMASNEHLGYMSDEKMIDTILKLDLKDIPQKAKWVDGSGLSRYNLFTPQSFVYLLNKMKNEFGIERLKNILPTGGEGTLSSYYKKDAGFIFAKTGTLSNNCALSGYLITSKGKLLIFSVLANNYITNATPVRKAVEQFLQTIREKY